MSRARGFFLFVVGTCTIAIGVPPIVGAVENANVCTSKECAFTASMIRKSMDPSVDPCTDFYKFSCGGFIRSTALSDERTQVDSELALLTTLTGDVERMLGEPMESGAPKHLNLLKTLYASCMNPASMGDGALEAHRNFLKTFGGWPVVDGDSWNGTDFNWRRAVLKFRQDDDGMSPLVNIRIENDLNGVEGMIQLNQYSGIISPGTAPEDFTDPVIQRYYNAMIDVAVSLGADRARASNEIREVILFEMRLANITLTDEEIIVQDPTVVMSIAELNKEYPGVPWMTYVKDFVGSSVDVFEDVAVMVEVPEYYVELEALMATTPSRLRANFVVSRIALRNMIYSSERTRIGFYNYLRATTGMDLDLSREHFCRTQVLASLWLSFVATFVSQYYNSTAVSNVNETAVGTVQQWNETLRVMNLMDGDVRQIAADEASALIDDYIYYPPELLNDAELGQFYANLEFTSDFFENMKRLATFDHDLWMKDLRQPFDPSHWTRAFGGSSKNSVDFITLSYIPISRSLLYGIYTRGNQPRYMSYGTVGKSIGYDVSLRQDWLAEKKDFFKRARCLTDRLKKNGVDDGEVEDLLGLDEHIANLLSTKVAYLAYVKAALRNNADEQKLPGLERYSSKQMFWISVAMGQCTKYGGELLAKSGIEIRATPQAFRVNNVMGNIKKFAEDFECPDNSPLRATRNCSKW